MDDNVILAVVLLVLLYMLYNCRQTKNYERFSMSTKPFEPDNTMLNRNPYDDIDYVTPVFLTKY